MIAKITLLYYFVVIVTSKNQSTEDSNQSDSILVVSRDSSLAEPSTESEEESEEEESESDSEEYKSESEKEDFDFNENGELTTIKKEKKVLTKDEEINSKWSQFKTVFNRIYPTKEEEAYRFGLFKDTYNRVEEHNKKYEANQVEIMEGLTTFADLTKEEQKGVNLGIKRIPNIKYTPFYGYFQDMNSNSAEVDKDYGVEKSGIVFPD